MPRSASRDLSDRYVGFRRYFRGRTPVESWKIRLSLFAATIAIAWGAWSFAARQATRGQLSPGPLAGVHAAWDAQCEACHRPKDGSPLSAGWDQFSCLRCHVPAKHHASVSETAANDCASCHRDHNGKSFSLVALADATCTTCHKTLPGSVTDFATNHPAFASLESRQSSLKFSHAQHLSPGIVATAGAKNPWLKDGQPVQLNCADCHTATADGRGYQPIRFDLHCASCHELKAPSVVTAGREVVPAFGVAHGKPLSDMGVALDGEYAKRLLEKHPALTIPVKPAEAAAYKAEVSSATATATKFLSLKCRECHPVAKGNVPKTAIPTVWLSRAKFDHAAHRATQCASCHPMTTGPDPDREPVHIRGLESCRECHSPRTATGGGVRHDCVTCHSYHARPHPAPAQALTVRELLGTAP